MFRHAAIRLPLLLVAVVLVGCNSQQSVVEKSAPTGKSLSEARQGFTTKLVSEGEDEGPPEVPDGEVFELIQYPSPVGPLAAYLTPDPGDGQKHPAIVWITGGDNNSISDVWSPRPRENDQSVSGFRKAGIVMMFPSQRGGNDNPGRREGFLGEADDILAATDYLEKLPYVDPQQIYLGGHSSGGTMAMLVGEYTDRYRAVFALGPVASPAQYGGSCMYCDLNDDTEVMLRSPLYWLDSVKSPMYVFEGADGGNWDNSIDFMVEENSNPNIKFFPIAGHDHFTVIAPLVEVLAEQVAAGHVEITPETIRSLE